MKHERGMGLVFQPTFKDKDGVTQTSPVYRIQYNVAGKRYRESANTTNRNVAVRLLKKRIAEAGSGRPFGHDVEKTTLANLAQMVLDDYQANGRRLRAVKAPLDHLLQGFGGDMRAMDVTSDRVTSYIANRQQAGAAAATINRSSCGAQARFRFSRPRRQGCAPPSYRNA
jgi:hypothetical protein